MVNIKGTAIVMSMNLARQTHGESGLKKVLDSLRTEDRETLSTVIGTGWYSLEAYVSLLNAELRDFCRGNELEFLEQWVLPGVEQQFKMIYKIFLQFRGPEQIMSRLSNINKQYFQGVSTEVRKIDENKFLLIYQGFEARHRVFDLLLKGWWIKILELIGKKVVHFQVQTSIGAGKEYSEFIISWQT